VNLLKALSTVSGMTLLSRITGLARESIKATAFGAGLQMDAFEAAFRLPNLLRRLFGEGAFAQAFVPILAEYRSRRGDADTRDLVARVAGLLTLVLVGVTVLGVLAAPWLVYLLAAGFERTPGKVELTATMIRIVFPYILFISLTSLAGSVLNVYRRFAIPAVTPVLLNLSIIGAAIFLARFFDPPIVALAVGVAIGGVTQLALQLIALARLGMLVRPSLSRGDEGVRRVLKAMGPAVLGVSAAQVSILISTQLAALLGDGRISWITYADRLMEFPTALLGVALGTVILPSLAEHHSADDRTAYASLLDWGLRLAIMLALPAALALWLVGVPLVATLYQYGHFAIDDVWQTRAALLGYVVGLPALTLVKILAPGFYARQELRTPVRVALVTVIVTPVIAIVLAWPLRMGHVGLTLATSLGACFNASVLFVLLRRRGHYQPAPGWGMFLLRIGVALAALGAVLHWLAGPAQAWLAAGLAWRAAHLALLVGAGIVAYFGVLYALGIRPSHFYRRDAGIAVLPDLDRDAD
jgi:putative peptidoglycan lipid II flippase